MAIDNKVDQFSENINKAIEIHVQNAITGLEFNKTEQAEIVDVSNAAAGDYVVSNGSARYHAFANESDYTLGTKVNVLIPNNDYSQQKLILGKAKRSTTQSLSYVSPLEGYEPKTKNILEDERKFNEVSSDIEKINAFLAAEEEEIPVGDTFLLIPEVYKNKKESIEVLAQGEINKSNSNFIQVYGAIKEDDVIKKTEYGSNKLIYFSEELTIDGTDVEEKNNINQNYKYMGLSAEFKTAFNNDIRVVSGDYGLDIVVLYSKKNQDLNQNRNYFVRTYRMSSGDMLGSIYDFSLGHKQEALFELETDAKEDVLIHRIAISLHQDGKFTYMFKNGTRETFPVIKYGDEDGENRVYVSNIELRLGNALDTRYKFDSISIHTEDGAYYDSAQVDDKNIQKTIVLDWTHTDPNTGLKTTFTRVPRTVTNQVDDSVATITWFRDYHYNVNQYRSSVEEVSEDFDSLKLILEEYQTFYEQNFEWITRWEAISNQEETPENGYWESFKDAQREIYENQYNEETDTEYANKSAYADAKIESLEQEVRNMNGSLVRLINELKLKNGTHYYYDPVNKAIMLTQSGREAAERKITRDSKTITNALNADAELAGDGWVVIGSKRENVMEIDFVPDRTVSTCKVKCVIQYGPIDSEGNYITSNPYYRVLESNELVFTNLSNVPDVATWDVSAGLQFLFKDKSNGFYPLYDYTGALIDQRNANKTRTLEVDMRTTLFGESYINGSEIIIWQLPKNNTMLNFSPSLVDEVDEKRTITTTEGTGETSEEVSITYGPHQVKELTSEEVNNLLGSHNITYDENYMYLKYEANENNNTVEVRDKDGNIQYKTDEEGNQIPITETIPARNYIKYKINEIYKPYFYNNTVICYLIKSEDGFFTGSTEIGFSNKGNNGTDYTLVLTLGGTVTVDNLVTYEEVINGQVSELEEIFKTEELQTNINNIREEIQSVQEDEGLDEESKQTYLEELNAQLATFLEEMKRFWEEEAKLKRDLDEETVEEVETEGEKEAYDLDDIEDEDLEDDEEENSDEENNDVIMGSGESGENTDNESSEEETEDENEDDNSEETSENEISTEDNSFKDLRDLPNIYISNDWGNPGPPEEAITLGEEKFHRIIFEVHDADGLKIELTKEQKNDIISSWVGALSKGYYSGVQNVKNLDFLCKMETTKDGEEFINNFTDIAVRANPGITTEESNLIIDGEISPSSDEDLKTLEDFKYIVMQLQLNTKLFEGENDIELEDIIDFDSDNKAFTLSNVNLLTLMPLNFRVNREDTIQGSNFLYYDDNGSLSKKYPFGYYLNNQSFDEQKGNISSVYNLVLQKLIEAREEKEKLISTLRDVYKSYMDAAAAELPNFIEGADEVEDGISTETSLSEEQQILQEFEKLLESQLKNDYSWLFQEINDPQVNGDYWFRTTVSETEFKNNLEYFETNLKSLTDEDEEIQLFGRTFLNRPYANWLRYILYKDFGAKYTTDIDEDHLDEAVFRSKYNKKLVKKKLDAAKKKYQSNVSNKIKAINKKIKPIKTKLKSVENTLKKIDAEINKYLKHYSLKGDEDDLKYFTVQEDIFTPESEQSSFTLSTEPVLNYFCVSINDVLQTNTKKITKYSISGQTLTLNKTVKENDVVKCTYYNYNPIIIENSQWKKDYSESIKPLEDILTEIEKQDKKIEDANNNIGILKEYSTVSKTAKQVNAYETDTTTSDVPGYDREILNKDWYAIDDLTDLQEIQIKIARFFNDFDDSVNPPIFKLSSDLTTAEKKEKNNYIDKFNKLKKNKIKAQQSIIDKAKKDKKALQKKLKAYTKGTIKVGTENTQLKETDSIADWKAFIYSGDVEEKVLNAENISKISKIIKYYTDIEKKINSLLSSNKDKKLRCEHLKNRYTAQIDKKNKELKDWKDSYYYYAPSSSRDNPRKFNSDREDEYRDYHGVKGSDENSNYEDYPEDIGDPKSYAEVLEDCYIIWNLNGVVPETITAYTINLIRTSAKAFEDKLYEFKDEKYQIPNQDDESEETTKNVNIIEYWRNAYNTLVTAQRKLGWFDVSVGIYNGELEEPIYEDLREKYTLSADKQEYIREIARKIKDEEYTPSEEEAKIVAAYLKEAERLQAECKKALQYYPSIEKKHTLKAPSFYSDGLNTNIAILCYEEIEDSEKGNLLYIMPLIIIRNTHDIASINKWNGQAVIDKDGNQIMSSLMAAGTKDKNNNFTGVIIGDIEPSGTQASYSSAKMNGIYGYHAGVQSFGIKTDGTSFLGKEGMGRIEFDGNKGTIQSGGYSIDEKIGTKIDLVTGDIDLYTRPPQWYEQYEDEDGNVEIIRSDEYGAEKIDEQTGEVIEYNSAPDDKYVHIHLGGNSPESSERDSYFSISAPSTLTAVDDNEITYKTTNQTPLMRIGQNEYFLQTANYEDQKDLINDQGNIYKDGETVLGKGLKIDLQNGEFDCKGKFTLTGASGSSIKFGNNSTEGYFEVNDKGQVTCRKLKVESFDSNSNISASSISTNTIAINNNGIYMSGNNKTSPIKKDIITELAFADSQPSSGYYITMEYNPFTVDINLGTDEEPNNKTITINIPKKYLKITKESVWVFEDTN